MIAPVKLSQLADFMSASLDAELHFGDISFSRVTTDTRSSQPGDLFVALRGERFDAHNFLRQAADKGVAAMVVERADASIAVPQLVVRDSLLALGQIAALNRAAYEYPLIAITGSSGKTTVKTMLANILRECGEVHATRGNLNNHIGVPLTLLELEAAHRYAVIEMGASALGEIAYLCALAKPDIALINNVMPAHIEGFGSIANVARAKGEIYQGLAQKGTAIVNIDDAYAGQWINDLDGKKIITVSLRDYHADCYAQNIEFFTESTRFTLLIRGQAIAITIQALGEHNVRNALAAAACAFAADASLSQIQQGLMKFAPVTGRMSRQLGIKGALVIDDSYNANPGSVRAAIDVLVAQPGETVLVLGDMAELGENASCLHVEVGNYARDKGVKQLFTVGSLSRNASDAFAGSARHFNRREDLVAELSRLANSDMTILVKGSRSAKTDLIVRALCEPQDNSNGEQR